jgi:hypothetical protein
MQAKLSAARSEADEAKRLLGEALREFYDGGWHDEASQLLGRQESWKSIIDRQEKTISELRQKLASVSSSAAASTSNGEDQVGSAPTAGGDERAAALPAEVRSAVESADLPMAPAFKRLMVQKLQRGWPSPLLRPISDEENAYFGYTRVPIPMLLWCPECKARHVDRGEFATRKHHTHSCQTCGHTWRPAVVPTVGVQFLPGFKDKP